MSEPRYVLRAAASHLPYSHLQWLANHERAPHMHRAEARREMRRRNARDAGWFADFSRRMEARAHRQWPA